MAVRIASIENHHHQEPPPSLRACPRASTWLPIHRALRERRALRRVSHLAVARRSGMGSSSCSSSSINSSLVAELQRSSLARRRAFVAAAHKFAVTANAAAELSAKQQQQQQQQQLLLLQQQQKQRAWPAVVSLSATPVIATPPPPPPPAAATAAAATALPRPPATAVRESKINPEVYFLNLLEKRGRGVTKKVSSQEAGYVKQPSAKQVLDYQSQPFMSDLVRKGDVDGLREAVEAGRGMDASNKFGESLVHVACRRGNMDVLRFLLENGGSLTCCDDLGRFPLHEVCWAVRPRFDIVRLFLDGERRPTTTTTAVATTTGKNDDNNNDGGSSESNCCSSSRGGGVEGGEMMLNPLLVTDKRGCTPLRYVKEESWPLWRKFLDEVVDEYWPSLV